jgi:hypothetical protein
MATETHAWSGSVADTTIASVTIPAGGHVVGDLTSMSNVGLVEWALSLSVVPFEPPSVRGVTFDQIAFNAIGDIDGTNSVTPTMAQLDGTPGANHPFGHPSGTATPGVTYSQVFHAAGKDFSGVRPCVRNYSQHSIVATVTTRKGTTKTA